MSYEVHYVGGPLAGSVYDQQDAPLSKKAYRQQAPSASIVDTASDDVFTICTYNRTYLIPEDTEQHIRGLAVYAYNPGEDEYVSDIGRSRN